MGWLTGYGHRKSVTITGQTGAGTLYQVDLSIAETAGGDFTLDSHALSFPNDIRFTGNDETTELDYWIEDLTVDPITAWVEVADSLESNVDIYCYYGKSGDSTTSDGDNTFLFFDHFPGVALDTTTNWNVVDGSTSVADSIVKVITGTPSGWIRSKATFPVNTRFRGRMYYVANTAWCAWGVDNADNYGTLFYPHHPVSNVLNAVNRNPYPTQTTANLGNVGHGAYNIFEIRRNSTISAIYLLNDTSVATLTTNVPTGSCSVRLFGQSQDLYSDWVFVSKYASPEPAFSSAGAEENVPTAIPVFMHHYSNMRET